MVVITCIRKPCDDHSCNFFQTLSHSRSEQSNNVGNMNLEDSRNANKLHRPSNRLRKIVRITRICSYICGADVFDPNYCVNIRTYIVLAVINFSILLLSYTMYSGWVEEGDWAIVLQVLTIGGGTLLQVGYSSRNIIN